jgi:hypothetical protein
VQALEKIINEGMIKEQQKELAIHELVKKSIILENGFRKRGALSEADYYQRLIGKYS